MLQPQYLKMEIVLLKNIGDLDEIKINAVSSVLNKNYPQKLPFPMGVAFAAQNQNDGIVLLSNQQLSYQNANPTQEGVGTSISVLADINALAEKLLISQKGKYVINVEFVFKAKNETFEETLDNEDSMIIKEYGIKGKAIKYFIDNDEVIGTYSFEPFTQDSSKYFVAFNVQPKIELDNFDMGFATFRKYRDFFQKLTEKIYEAK